MQEIKDSKIPKKISKIVEREQKGKEERKEREIRAK